MNKIRNALRLFRDFLRFGFFSFGGGWSIVTQMRQQYVEKENSLTGAELLDLTSVGRSVPGLMIGNIAVLFGYREAGVLGGIASLVGVSLPPVAVLMVVTHFYTLFHDNLWVAAAMGGVRAAVVPIIASAVIGLAKAAFTTPPRVAVGVLTLLLYLFLHVNCVWLVVIGIVCGLLISEYHERREGGK